MLVDQKPEQTGSGQAVRLISLLALALCVGLFFVERATAAPRTEVPVELATTVLAAGEEGVIRVDGEGLTTCSLRFLGPDSADRPRLSAGPYRVQLDAPSIEWRWEVPRAVVPGAWSALIDCSKSAAGPQSLRAELKIDTSTASSNPSAPIVAAGSLETSLEFVPERGALSTVDRAQIAVVVVALLGLLVVAWELIVNSRRARDERAAGYLRRYQEPAFTEVAGRARGFLETTSTDERDRKKERHADAARVGPTARLLPTRWPPDPRVPFASRSDLNEYATFFEELGASFNAGVLDKRTVARVLGTVVYLSYRRSEWFLMFRNNEKALPVEISKSIGWLERVQRFPVFYRRRRTSGPFQEWGEMCRELRRLNPELAEHD